MSQTLQIGHQHPFFVKNILKMSQKLSRQHNGDFGTI